MIRIDGLRPALLGIAFITIPVLLSACATPPAFQSPPLARTQTQAPGAPPLTPHLAAAAESLTRLAAQQERLYRVAAPLLIDNAQLCKSHARNLLGFTAKNRYSYPGEFNEAAHIAFGMDERLQVTGVLAGSGAARAGLRSGDGLLTAGGKVLPTGPNASTVAGAVFGPLVRAHPTLVVGIERDGDNRQLSIPVTRACGFGVEVGNADNVNSYADGQRVMVTRGMMQFARADDELAYVLAKGMAHNMLDHAASERNAGTIGSIIDNLGGVRPDTSMLIGSGGIKAMPPQLDAAADRLALYLVARAGYRIDGAAAFWKRLAATYPASVLNGYVANHPATGPRLAAIDKTVAEIKSRQSSRRPLMP